MHKKIISVVVAFSLIYGGSTPVMASSLNDTLTQQQNQLNSSKSSLKEVQQKREQLESQVEILDTQIESAMAKISEINSNISDTEDEIKKTEEEIEKAQEDIESEQAVYKERVRAMYINGTDTYLEVILNSKSFSDLISRIDRVKQVIQYDKDLMDSLAKKKEAIEKRKEELDKEKSTLLSLKKQNEQQLEALNAKKEEQAKVIAQVKAEEQKYSSKVAEEQKLVDQTMKQIEAIRAKTQTYVPSRGAAQISDNSIVAYATNFLGIKYTWGGNYPQTGFDCSGFVKYVYAHFGIQLPRVAASQATVGTTVSKSQLQPGDLVFFAYSSGYIHHVGIYVGNGCYIHAPHTGDVVKISPLSRSDFVYGKRIR